jgi:hypothetical protein
MKINREIADTIFTASKPPKQPRTAKNHEVLTLVKTTPTAMTRTG